MDTQHLPDLGPKYGNKVAWRPHMLLLYAGHLRRVFEAAGTPLQAVHVHSCSALNARPAQKLYMPSANLLDYEGEAPRSVVERREAGLERELSVEG